MRLVRRLTDSIRSHDWFFVVVDIAVLVLGLLLAFQVDRWWEARKERREERAYLLRLWEESGVNLRLARERADLQDSKLAELLAIQRAWDDPAALRRVQEADPDAGCRMLHLAKARVENTAYAELVEGDRLDILRDAELKTLLRNAIATHAYVDGQLEYFRSSLLQYRPTLAPYHRYAVDKKTGAVTCSIALQALARDPSARATLTTVYRDQNTFDEWREEEVEVIAAVRDRLACLLEKPECRAAQRR